LLQFAGFDALQGNINNGKIGIQRGMVNSNLNLALGQNGQGMTFAGGVNLATTAFQDFSVTLSPAMLKKLPLPKEVMGVFNNGLTAPITGPASSPRIDLLGAAQKTAAKQLPGNLLPGLPGLFNGGRSDAQQPTPADNAQPAAQQSGPNNGNNQPTTQPAQPTDPLQQLFNDIANQGKSKRKNK
jgi:hypothetical protein